MNKTSFEKISGPSEVLDESGTVFKFSDLIIHIIPKK